MFLNPVNIPWGRNPGYWEKTHGRALSDSFENHFMNPEMKGACSDDWGSGIIFYLVFRFSSFVFEATKYY
jgi:hypothetical protein